MTFLHHIIVWLGVGLMLAALGTFAVGIVKIEPDRSKFWGRMW